MARLGTPWFSVGPLTGQPVSVIQTGLPAAAAVVLAKASRKSALASSMELAMVFWKYGYASMPMKSEFWITALFDPLTHAVQVSTCPTGAPLKGVLAMVDRTCAM